MKSFPVTFMVFVLDVFLLVDSLPLEAREVILPYYLIYSWWEKKK